MRCDNTPPHYAICHDHGLAMDALALAIKLRRNGIVTDCASSSKARKQFDRAKRGGAQTIVTVKHDGMCRVWWPYRSAINATIDDFLAYALWIEDDGDTLPEPPEYMVLVEMET